MKWIITVLIIACSANGVCQQKITDTTAISLIKQIAAYNVFESEILGDNDAISLQFERFTKLKAILTNEQFFKLAMTHRNGVVRAYAYYHCFEIKKELKDFDRLINRLKKDKTKIKTVIGCLGRVHPINRFFSFAD